MKLNKTFGRIATTLVATAMLASMAVVPASAVEIGAGDNEEGTYDNGTTAVTEITFTKGLIIPARVEVPDVSFKFEMEGTLEGQATISDGNNSIPTTQGTGKYEGTVTFGDADKEETTYSQDVLDSSYTTINGAVRYTDKVTISLEGLSFEQPGVYKYKLTETRDGDNEHADDYILATDSTSYYVYLYAQRVENDVVITGVSMDSGNAQSKTNEIDNYYKVSPDTGVDVGSLQFTKMISGEMGDKSDTFTFTVSGNGIENGTAYTVKIGNAGETTQTAANGCLTFTGIGDNTTVYVYGLDAGEYTIKEDAATLKSEGYKLTVSGDGKKNNVNDTEDTNQIIGATTDVEAKANEELIFTNTRNAVSPTGLVMDIAPYALLVIVAAAGCFLFLRKRRED